MRVTAFRGTDRTTDGSPEPGADGHGAARRLNRRRVGTWVAVGACVLAALAWVGGMPTREYTVQIGLRPLPANAGHGEVGHDSPGNLRSQDPEREKESNHYPIVRYELFVMKRL